MYLFVYSCIHSFTFACFFFSFVFSCNKGTYFLIFLYFREVGRGGGGGIDFFSDLFLTLSFYIH